MKMAPYRSLTIPAMGPEINVIYYVTIQRDGDRFRLKIKAVENHCMETDICDLIIDFDDAYDLGRVLKQETGEKSYNIQVKG